MKRSSNMIRRTYRKGSLVRIFLMALLCALSPRLVLAQGVMQEKTFNLTSFSPAPVPEISNELISMTSPSGQQHPEFGILPFNKQCDSCYELIDKRTPDSRYYVKKGTNGNRFFIQQCYGFLHYPDNAGHLLSIDPRLKPDPAHPGVYFAPHQPMPTSLDMTSGGTWIKLQDFAIHFNDHVDILEVQGASETPVLGAMSPANSTVGEEGAYTVNAWNGIDRTVTFGQGEIETNYILQTAPSVSSQGWIAFEDRVTLPAGYTFRRDTQGIQTLEGYWTGMLKLINTTTNQEVATWGKPLAYDSTQTRPSAVVTAYQVKSNGNTYFIRTMVRNSWLLASTTRYPVTIDPPVSAANTWSAGKIGFSNYAPGNGFCGNSSGWCLGGPLNVTFPGGATITNVVWGVTYHANIGNSLNQAGFRMVGPCGEDPVLPAQANNWYSCGSFASGNCAGSGFSAPWLATCLVPSCAATVVPFNIKNIDCSGVSGACGIASYFTTNNTWTITVSGSTLENLGNTVTGNGTQTVTGSCWANSTLDPTAANGVPAYTYSWSPGGQTTATITVFSGSNCTPCGTYTCTVTDACGNARTAVFTFNVSDCVLPIEMLSFDAIYNGKSVDITWETATETNNSYFTVERSTDAQNFSGIGHVNTKAADGNSAAPLSYALTDMDVKPGMYYYRLKQTDRNGHFVYMHTLPVSILPEADAFSVAPNPAKNLVDIVYQSYDGTPALLKIFSVNGQLELSTQLESNRGRNTSAVDLSTVPQGMHFITLISGGQTYKVKLVKE